MSQPPLDPYHAALEAAEGALMAAWGDTDPTRRQALLSDAARWVAAAQAANDTGVPLESPMPDPTETPPATQIAEVQATIARQRRWAGPLLRPVWDVLARLTALVATLIRRQGD